ncbi:ATP synthase archaeal subunit H [Natronosalvus vescus]|uniref:ATP synthase archaeal subunit H n=1 Tax=Natronosalvus vescus TaxID=2953881 RepID=UPI0020912B13|nr:ATP synthase archaeal subunit H [Natronosalvus vescus]
MPRPQVLKEITSAEEEADKIVALAKNDRDERIAEARERAEEIRTEAEQEARDLKERRLEDAREEIDAECERVLREGKQDREALADSARTKVGEVTDHVVELFQEDVNAQT